MGETADWVGLETLEKQELALKNGLGFMDALKCRWMRKDPEWSQQEWEEQAQNCLVNIENRRKLLRIQPFDVNELSQLYEERYTNEPSIQPIISDRYIAGGWNRLLYESPRSLKTWLDQGGDVTMTAKFLSYSSEPVTLFKPILSLSSSINFEIAKILIAAGANVNAKTR